MDFKCVSVINQMLFNESKAPRRDRGKESLISQESDSDYNYMWVFFFCVPDLLINLLHLFLFLTQRIRGGFPLIKKSKKIKEKTPKKSPLPKYPSFWILKLIIQRKILASQSIFRNVLIYFFTINNPIFLNLLRDFSCWTCQEETFFPPSLQFCQPRIDPANYMLPEHSNQY